MTIKEIDEQIAELKHKRRVLTRQERNEFLEHARTNVGRCFKVNNVLVKVIDVPKVKQTMTGTSFNQYQYPSIWLTDNEGMPFYIDTLFSAAWGVGHDTFNKYEEITQEEFNAKFDELIKEFSHRIKGENNET